MRRGPCSEVVGLQRLSFWEPKEKGLHPPAGPCERVFKLKIVPGVFRLESHQAALSL